MNKLITKQALFHKVLSLYDPPWPSMISTTWCSDLSIIPSSLSVGITCDLFLTKRIRQRWWDVTSVIQSFYIRLYLATRLPLDSLSPWTWSKWSCWESPRDKELWAVFRFWVHWQLTANVKIGPSILQPHGNEFCQQPEWAWKEVLPQSSFKIRMQPGQQLDCKPYEALGKRSRWAMPRLLTHRNYENKCMLF